MGKTLDAVLAEMPARRRRRIQARAQELIAEEMTLRELRKAMGKTQVQLARRLGKPQAAISRMEQQSDMLLSTLSQVVEGLGGKIRIVAELPGRAPVELTALGDIGGEKPRAVLARASRRVTAPVKKVATGRSASAPRTRRARKTSEEDTPVLSEIPQDYSEART